MDLERLDEALEWWSIRDSLRKLPSEERVAHLAIAARAYRDLLANGERVEPTDEWFIRLANGIERMLKGMPIDRPFMEQQLRELRALVDPPTEEDT